ncbi:MAG: DUF2125 domain-containing protein [Pararhodobacter sp.]
MGIRAVIGLLSVAVLATLAWGGYWFAGARALDRAVVQQLETNPFFSADSHRVRGFPNRFDLTLNEPSLSQPGLSWRAPFVQFFALSYRPHHLIAVFAHDQEFVIAGTAFALHSRDMRASLVMAPEAALPLERLALVVERPELRSSTATHRAEALRFATRALTSTRHQAVLELQTLFADTAMMAALDPAGHWPRRLDLLSLEIEAEFDRALDRHAMAGPPPYLVGLALTRARLAFDGIALTASGRLEADALGLLSGPLTLEISGWPALLERLREAGLIAPEEAVLWQRTLQGLADPADPARLEAQLAVREGLVRLGPLVLGSLPPLFQTPAPGI